MNYMVLKDSTIKLKFEIPKEFYDLERQIIFDLGADIEKTDQYKKLYFLKKAYCENKNKHEPGIKIVLCSDHDTHQPYLALIDCDEKAPGLDFTNNEKSIRSFNDVVNDCIEDLANLTLIEATDPDQRDAVAIEALPELRKKRNKILGSKGRLHEEIERIGSDIELPDSASHITLENILKGKQNIMKGAEVSLKENVYKDINISGRVVISNNSYFYYLTTDDNNKSYELRFYSKSRSQDYYWILMYALEFREKVTIEFTDDETFQSRTNSTILNLEKVDFTFDIEKVRIWKGEVSGANSTEELPLSGQS